MYAYTELLNKFNRGSNPNKLSYKLENNTYVERWGINNYQFNIVLHNSIIANILQDKIILNSCGWKTPTTKDRMNKILSDNKVHFTIYQSNHVWRVHPDYLLWDDYYIFEDGLTFKWELNRLHGNAWQIYNFAQDNTTEINQLKRKITKYVNQFYEDFTKNKIPIPSAGDCFYCCMVTKDNVPLGDAFHDKTHLLSHIDESYFVPSLLVNAVKSTPQSIMSNNLMYSWIYKTGDLTWLCSIVGSQIKKSLYRYMIDKLITN